MLTKADFHALIRDSVAQYPTLATLYDIQDPLLLQHLDAIAAMLGLYAQQLDVAMLEPFAKVRDGTVLADAAMRGIVPRAIPARVRLQVTNGNPTAYTLEAGRVLLDAAGLPWVVVAATSVPAGATLTAEALQYRTVDVQHTVRDSTAFYPIALPAADDGALLAGVAVTDAEGDYAYCERYVNVAAGERVFHIEADERQQVFVRFGLAGVVGVQPADGTVLVLRVGYSHGANAQPAAASPLSLAYIASPADSAVTLQVQALVQAGQNPLSMAVLRDLARYPSVYDHSAVYLGEFEFLVRRQVGGLRFLSVWNERIEERTRGASLENVNVLFVAVVAELGLETVADNGAPLQAIPEEALTAVQKDIRDVIWKADNSYRVRFYPPARSPVAVDIRARVSTNFVAGDVVQQIRTIILAQYGEDSPASRRSSVPTHQDVYSLLLKQVGALQAGKAELVVNVDNVAECPECWVYVAADSLSVTVEMTNTIAPTWGY